MNKKYFRKISWLLCILTLVLMLPISGCGKDTGATTGADEEKLPSELNLFCWSEYMPQDVLDKFEQEYNIKVNYSTFSSNEEMLAKLQAGGASQYDVAVASDYMIEIMLKQKEQLLEPLDLNNIPNLENIDKQYKNLEFDPGNKYTVPYLCGTALIVLNTDKVKIPVTGYKDLWDPEFKNSLVVLDDERAIIGMGLKKLGYSLNETDEKKLVQAGEEIKDLLPNIKAFDSDSPKTLLINGEASGGMIWSGEVTLAMAENPQLKVVFPEEGMYLWMDNFFIPKGAPNKKAAELFMNFILEPEISAMVSQSFPYTNPNVAAQQYMDASFLKDPSVFPPEEELAKGEHLKDVGEATTVYDQIWSEIKAQ